MDIHLGYTNDFLTSICRYYKKGRLLEKNSLGNNMRVRIGHKKSFYKRIKTLFYDSTNHKWLVKNGVNYIRQKKIKPEYLTDFLRDFRTLYLKNNNGTNSMKQFLKFIENLESNSKLLPERLYGKGLRLNLKPSTNFMDFLEDFYAFTRHIEAKDTMLIDLLYNVVETNYQKSTLTRLYYDNKPKTEKK